LIDAQSVGHQLFPDIAADGGVLHAVWWDSRNDPAYSPTRPIGNDAAGVTVASLDVFGARSSDFGATWTAQSRLTDVTTNPNFEQFSNRSVPFAGDYLWVTSAGSFAFGVWTDWRNTVAGSDPREGAAEDNDAADVKQRQLIVTLDGTRLGELMFGETLTHEMLPGPHRLRISNTLFWKTIAFEAKPGAQVRFEAVNRAGKLTYPLMVVLGAGPLYLTVRKVT